jgi:hypothetical protein
MVTDKTMGSEMTVVGGRSCRLGSASGTRCIAIATPRNGMAPSTARPSHVGDILMRAGELAFIPATPITDSKTPRERPPITLWDGGARAWRSRARVPEDDAAARQERKGRRAKAGKARKWRASDSRPDRPTA